jgi:hypothetical protein
MSLDPARYQALCPRYDEEWKVVDETLYALCKQHPKHNNRGSVNAKLWIIGRSYATGIERMVESDGNQASSLRELADHFLANCREVDAIIAGMPPLTERLTRTHLCSVLSAHGRLMEFVQEVLRAYKTPRSFASKYLHFHNPSVPIYDSYAARAARKLFRRSRNDEKIAVHKGDTVDASYQDFLTRYWKLHQAAEKAGLSPNAKLLDYYLLDVASEL